MTNNLHLLSLYQSGAFYALNPGALLGRSMPRFSIDGEDADNVSHPCAKDFGRQSGQHALVVGTCMDHGQVVGYAPYLPPASF